MTTENIYRAPAVPPEEFYAQSDSVYIRIKFLTKSEVPGFRFTLRDEAQLQNKPNANMTAIGVGIMTVASQQCAQLHQLGMGIIESKMLQEQMDGMPEEHKRLLSKETAGTSN